VIHDLDGDGLQDIVVANLSGRLALLYGSGAGQFSAAVDSAESIGLSYELGPGDFDGDGALDLARPSEAGNVSWLFGDRHGGFVDFRREEAGVTPSDIVADDFDGDGRLDLVATNAGSDDLSVLLGEGAGTFMPEQRLCVEAAVPPCPAGSEPAALRAGELTGDVHLDLAVANAGSDNVSILAGDGSGGFSFLTSVTVYAGMAPSHVALGDLNNDDDQDLVVVGEGSNLLGVYLGDGSGGFSAPPGFPTGVGANPVAVALCDLDGDDYLDVLVANSGSDNVTVLLGDGDGTFTYAPTVPSGDNPTDVALGDVNHDSFLDLAIADQWGNTVYVYPGNGDGSFGTPTVLDSGGYSVKIADLDGDGNQEIAVEFGNSYVFPGNGDGTFGAKESYLGGGKRFALGDYNLDSRLDWAGVGIRISTLLNQFGPEALGFEADGATLSWPAETGALSYDIYRGDLSSLVDGNGDGLPDAGYGSCRTQDDDDPRDTFFEDAELPSAAGAGFFYLMSVIDSAGAGGLGTTSAGLPRVPAVPCP